MSVEDRHSEELVRFNELVEELTPLTDKDIVSKLTDQHEALLEEFDDGYENDVETDILGFIVDEMSSLNDDIDSLISDIRNPNSRSFRELIFLSEIGPIISYILCVEEQYKETVVF